MRYAQTRKGNMDTAVRFDGIERELGGNPELSIIWLHGLGADAGDFLPLVGELALPCATRFVFPNAPFRPVTINGGMVMRAWYDIYGFDVNAREDTQGLLGSAATIRGLVGREVERGMPVERVVLAGFSQGGAVVLHAGLGGGQVLGGILGLSTYLPAPALLASSPTLMRDIPVAARQTELVATTHAHEQVPCPLDVECRIQNQTGIGLEAFAEAMSQLNISLE
jgi:predicted esterase